MNETEIRERLFDLADDAPEGFTAPPQLLRRARRRAVVTLTSSALVVIALIAGGIAGVRWFGSFERRPAVRPGPILPELGREILDIRGGDLVSGIGGGDLVAVDLDTGGTRILVEEILGTIRSAAWSSDGRWVAYDLLAARCGATTGLWVKSSSGEPRQLTTGDCRSGGEPWAWSPAGSQLATMRTSTDGHTLILIDPSTGRETNLGDIANMGSLSPDGSRIVYGERGESIYSIDVVSGDHSLLAKLPRDLDSIDEIDWSPDGAHIAIVADLAEARRRLYVMNADGSGLRLVHDNVQPGGSSVWIAGASGQALVTWSPDGSRLAYTNFSGPDERELEMWTLSLDDPAPSLLVSHTNRECCIDGGGPVWSPDGSRIAFATDNSHLVIAADGTGDPREIEERTYRSWLGGWYFCYCYG
jgi:WD40 repeat protein